MNDIKAIGFDLFNTLITAEPQIMIEANRRLFESLCESGLVLEDKPFKKAHRDAALHFLEEAQREGRETHNSLWISAALKNLGYNVLPEDPQISTAVETYFSAFYDYCHLIPGTKEMLGTLAKDYRLGLLSNFTHAPAARKIIENLDIDPFFEVVLISGELGYRKPHPLVFSKLIEHLEVDKNQIAFVGDDVEPDIEGARRAGLQPVWTTWVHDQNIPATSAVLSRGRDTPDSDVPRISTWKDLLSLLGKGN
jgi:putative hydrolase of the HAD superfamily